MMDTYHRALLTAWVLTILGVGMVLFIGVVFGL